MSQPRLTVVVTRERADASNWVQALQQHDFEVCALPWLELNDIPSAQLVPPSLPADAYKAVMFVSAKAARVLARQDVAWVRDLHQAWAQGCGPRAWAPGPGTQRQLLELGVPAEMLDTPDAQAPQHDTENLWLAVRGQIQATDSICVVRGQDAWNDNGSVDAAGVDSAWPANRNALFPLAQGVGAHVHEWVVYQRGPAVWTPAESQDWAKALSRPDAVWIAGSAMALNCGQVLALRHGLSTDWCAQRKALTWHPRVQAHAQFLGWAPVALCEPGLDAVLLALTNLQLKGLLS